MHKQTNKNKKRRFKSGTFKPSEETFLRLNKITRKTLAIRFLILYNYNIKFNHSKSFPLILS